MAYHGIAPSFGEEGVAKDLDRVPRVDVTRVQRGEAESHHVRRPDVADDSTSDQGAHDRVALRMTQGDLASPVRGVDG